ncbi:c-type cytochrome [Rhizobium sullae]|uniref:c-type cytochrome n=1 Tax=Rhizobium sullae TaxID=50338 RepID=UPI001FCD6990|nr:c-type cytochrome [Rhizobium sullae]
MGELVSKSYRRLNSEFRNIQQDIAMRTATVAVIAGTFAAVPAARAQDILHGHRLALEVCATCHAVLADQTRSPVAEAPSFEAVAVTPGMTAMALNVWLTAQSHPTMPNIILSQTDVQDVSAYILSLAE